MKSIDPDVLAAYDAGIEKGRLRSGPGLIEFARSKELLAEHLPEPPAIVYDIGGGYGEYAWHLAAQGYCVHLFDISTTNIALSAQLAREYTEYTLESAEVTDARTIDRPDGSADAILLMGPLYHIVKREERLRALRECHRLLKPGGRLFTGAISRYATTLWAISVYGTANELLDETAFRGMLWRELSDGQHITPRDSAYHGMRRSFFHLPDELQGELAEAGFSGNAVHGVIGCGWLAPNLDELWQDEARREIILSIVRRTDQDENLLGLSTHLLAISTKG